MKIQAVMICIALLFGNMPAGFAKEATSITEQEAIDLVNEAIQLITKIGDEKAFEVIRNKNGGFFNQKTALYAFVYDENVIIRAHPYKPELERKSFKGKPDVRGKKFRDEIVEKALIIGEGWTEYSYEKPGVPGIYRKKVYGKLVEYKDKKYIVCAGIYLD